MSEAIITDPIERVRPLWRIYTFTCPRCARSMSIADHYRREFPARSTERLCTCGAARELTTEPLYTRDQIHGVLDELEAEQVQAEYERARLFVADAPRRIFATEQPVDGPGIEMYRATKGRRIPLRKRALTWAYENAETLIVVVVIAVIIAVIVWRVVQLGAAS